MSTTSSHLRRAAATNTIAGVPEATAALTLFADTDVDVVGDIVADAEDVVFAAAANVACADAAAAAAQVLAADADTATAGVADAAASFRRSADALEDELAVIVTPPAKVT